MGERFEFIACADDKRAVDTEFLSLKEARRARAFHQSIDVYRQTPMAHLKETAALLGVADIFVKDESHRFGLNAFKGLGGSYAIGRVLAGKLGKDEPDFAALTSLGAKAELGELTFITATDGNHGRGVAWAARIFGHRAFVRMPKGSAAERLQNIRAQGAEADITDVNYDDTVRLCAKMAQENGWILVQDTSWDGYEEIPRTIMQGYMTMGLEAMEQMPEKPTHIFLQAGVGSMAAAIAGLYADAYGKSRPKIVIVEPNDADCFYRSALAGERRIVTGDMPTIMAGLACGEPCPIAWNVLARCAHGYITCPDGAAAKGMRMLGNPWGADDRVIAGESGASAFGCVAEIMSRPQLAGIRDAIGLDETSRILFFNTEGATDRENYRRVCWDGAYGRGK